jgi:hypothetical protein
MKNPKPEIRTDGATSAKRYGVRWQAQRDTALGLEQKAAKRAKGSHRLTRPIGHPLPLGGGEGWGEWALFPSFSFVQFLRSKAPSSLRFRGAPKRVSATAAAGALQNLAAPPSQKSPGHARSSFRDRVSRNATTQNLIWSQGLGNPIGRLERTPGRRHTKQCSTHRKSCFLGRGRPRLRSRPVAYATANV